MEYREKNNHNNIRNYLPSPKTVLEVVTYTVLSAVTVISTHAIIYGWDKTLEALLRE